jgi:hypothetical protein
LEVLSILVGFDRFVVISRMVSVIHERSKTWHLVERAAFKVVGRSRS